MAVTTTGYYTLHTAAGDTTTGRLKVKDAYWQGFTDAGHTLQIKDSAGTIVFPELACGALPAVLGYIRIPINRILDGIETDVIGSGTVFYTLD